MPKLATGRKRVDLNAAARFPGGRDVIWSAIRKLRTGFSIMDIERTTRINESTIRTYVQGLTKAGYLERLNAEPVGGRYPRAAWNLIRDVGIDAPRVTRTGKAVSQGLGRENMWRTMRILNSFTVVELCATASTDTVTVDIMDAQHYCKYLQRAGYLRVVTPGHSGKRRRYALLKARYSGPKPPMIQRVHQVFDPNLGAVVWPKDGAA